LKVLYFLPSTYFLFYDFDLRASHARTLLPAALASVSFGFVLVRVRVSTLSRLKTVNQLYSGTTFRSLRHLFLNGREHAVTPCLGRA